MLRTLFCIFTLYLSSPPLMAYDTGHLLFLMKCGKIEEAIETYKQAVLSQNTQNFELLHELAWSLLKEGVSSDEPEEILLALFGASLTTEEQALPLFLKALRKNNPEIQLAAIHFLSKMHHDLADKELTQGMASNELLIRLETLRLMAQKKMPETALQADSLMAKLPPEIYPLFPQLFALTGDAASLKRFRRFLSDPDPKVRASAIVSVEQTRLDEFLPQVRRLSKSTDPLVQEASASCLGALKDEKGREDLERLVHSKHPTVRLAALKSLYLLDDLTAKENILFEAQQGNPFAFDVLAYIEGCQDFLAHQLKHPDKAAALNAALALLHHKDPRCLPLLADYLIEDSKGLALIPQASPAKALLFWKPIASAQQKMEDKPQLQEQVLREKEAILEKIFLFPDEVYLKVAKHILQSKQKALIPSLMTLLEKSATEQSIALLQEFQQKPGAPLVRQMCALSLYRLQEEGPYLTYIKDFIREWKGVELIRFRPLIPPSLDPNEAYLLTPEEISRIVIESLEALVQLQDNEAIAMILDAIVHGSKKNRYALAGILVRASM